MPGHGTPDVGEFGLVGKGDWRIISKASEAGPVWHARDGFAYTGWDCDGTGRTGSSRIQSSGPASTLPRP